MLAFGAFETLEPAFAPMPLTPDPMTVSEALSTPDSDDWTAVMEAEINNMKRLHVFKEVLQLIDWHIVTPRWVFCHKFEQGTLVKHKVHLVA